MDHKPTPRATRPPIMAYLVKRPGKPVTLHEIMKETGLTGSQIQAQFRMMIADGLPITVITRANIWRYDPEPEHKEATASDIIGKCFEAVGVTKSGAILLRDEDGIMYAANPLDI